jgi:hypothetical protein
MVEQTSPGVARQQITFLVLPRKVIKRNRPRFAAASRFPRPAASKRGGFFFGSFLLAAQKKGTSCRATPGGFDFVVVYPSIR